MKFFASKRVQRVTNFSLALMLVVSTISASVPFLFAKSANAEAGGYNVTVAPACDNGLVRLNITGDNPNNSTVWVKSSANFKFSAPAKAGPESTNVAVPIQFDQAAIPDGGVTIYYAETEDGPYQLLSGTNASAPYAAFNCYDMVYVAPATANGSDTNQGTTTATPFASIQKALDTVNENGTVYVADGVYTDTAVIKKSGTKLIGASGNANNVEIHTLPNASGQGGIYADNLNNITIKNLAAVGTPTFTNGGVIKLANGINGTIDNVVVKSADVINPALAQTNTTGININSFSNISINNTYVAGFGKDGISFVGKQTPTTAVTTQNVSLTNTSVSGSGASNIAFYTKEANITGVTFQNVRAQYGPRGIYIDGNSNTKTVTGPNGGTLNLTNTVIKDNTGEYINNEQTADINAVGVVLDHQARASWNDVAAKDLTPAELAVVQTTRIKDATGKNSTNLPYGVVFLQAPAAPVLTSTLTTLNAAQPTKNVTWTHPGTNVNHFEYREYINEAAAIADDAYYTPSVASADRTKSVGGSWGTHTLYYAVVAIDNAGNRSLRSEVGKIIIDRETPVIAPSADANTLVKGTKTFTITQTEANPSTLYVEYMEKDVNGNWKKKQGQEFGATNTANLVVDTTNWNEGLHQIKVTSKDITGNASGYSFTVTVDNTPPQITLKTGSTFTVGSGNVFSKVSFSLYDANKVVSYKIGTTVTNVTPNTYSDANFITVGQRGAVLGQNTITLYDAAGNSVSRTFILDNVAPGVTINSIATNPTTISGTVTEAATVKISVDNGTPIEVTTTNGVWSIANPATAQGTHNVSVVATDAAGNTTTPAETATFLIDTVAPATTVNGGTFTTNQPLLTGTTDLDAVSVGVFILDANENIVEQGTATITYGEDGATWSYATQTALGNADYTVVAVASDEFGNTSDEETAGFAVLTIAVPASTPAAAPATTLATVAPTTTPAITSPAAAAVLGATDNNTEAVQNGTSDVAGATDDKTASAVDGNNGTIFGLAWYWWILILAALAALAWFIIAAIRRRNEEEA